MPQNIENKVNETNQGIQAGRHLREIARRGASSANHEKDNTNNSLTRRLGRGAKLFLAGAYLTGLIGLGGCATSGGYTVKNSSNEIRKKTAIIDSKSAFAFMNNPQWRGDKTLFYGYSKSGTTDIFTMNKEGSDLKNLTNTQNSNETFAYWTEDGRIVYQCGSWKKEGSSDPNDYEVTSWVMDSDGSNKQRISFDLYKSLGGEKILKEITVPK